MINFEPNYQVLVDSKSRPVLSRNHGAIARAGFTI